MASHKSDSSKVIFIVLRYMRRPLLALIAVYVTSMVGWILIPGSDGQNLGFFHAFYFLTYTVTTTGFGELPHAFTEAQRMWGIVSLYAGVIAWFYALGSIIGLVQNDDFKRSVAERRFAKQVERIREPFYLVCGYGGTGALLVRGLSDAGKTVIVLDMDEERISTIPLRDYRSLVFGFHADVRNPHVLIGAGIQKPNCEAVVALTRNEDVNLKVSVTARMLNPSASVLTQSTSEIHEEILSTLGENVHIVDPFQTYAKYVGATIDNPLIHTLNQWLSGTPGATLDDRFQPPEGAWILCGYGRMGRWFRESLERQGVENIVIEPNPGPYAAQVPGMVVGRASRENLMKSGVEKAAGLLAGTDRDSDNMSILLTAKALNPGIFTIVRQNRYRNEVVFRGGEADLIMTPQLVSARRMLFLMIAPMMKPFFESLRARSDEHGGLFVDSVIDHLADVVGGTQPKVWTIGALETSSRAMLHTMACGGTVRLRHLVSDPVDRTKRLACAPLVLYSGEDVSVLPDLDQPVYPGDEILMCGDARAYNLVEATLSNDYTLYYLITGKEFPRGWVFQWLLSRRRQDAVAEPAEAQLAE